ncbi:hypothetical protein PR048_019949 [Dryococelus australis]|uniref:Uncharacterized protein n=1 Tax=Dryococelus australis TaxID=614101 RepID=A0ABQ9H4Y6_9NEOP|nr:hypothetical protein PR048_019949 [Dryococelus australis]
MPLIKGFPMDLLFSSPLHSNIAPYSPRYTLIGSHDFHVKSRLNLSTVPLNSVRHMMKASLAISRPSDGWEMVHRRAIAVVNIWATPGPVMDRVWLVSNATSGPAMMPDNCFFNSSSPLAVEKIVKTGTRRKAIFPSIYGIFHRYCEVELEVSVINVGHGHNTAPQTAAPPLNLHLEACPCVIVRVLHRRPRADLLGSNSGWRRSRTIGPVVLSGSRPAVLWTQDGRKPPSPQAYIWPRSASTHLTAGNFVTTVLHPPDHQAGLSYWLVGGCRPHESSARLRVLCLGRPAVVRKLCVATDVLNLCAVSCSHGWGGGAFASGVEYAKQRKLLLVQTSGIAEAQPRWSSSTQVRKWVFTSPNGIQDFSNITNIPLKVQGSKLKQVDDKVKVLVKASELQKINCSTNFYKQNSCRIILMEFWNLEKDSFSYNLSLTNDIATKCLSYLKQPIYTIIWIGSLPLCGAHLLAKLMVYFHAFLAQYLNTTATLA